MVCRFCEQRDNFVNAHVIPQGFFRRLGPTSQAPRLLTNADDEYPKKAPSGVYDPAILCAECEPLFSEWDDYAQKLLRDEPRGCTRRMVGRRIVGYEVANWRYDLLKLFFIAVVWRASVSTQSFYKRIELGPYEARAKALLHARDPGQPEEFAVTLAKFEEPWSNLLLDPHPLKSEGVNFQQFVLGGYVAYVKTDAQRAPKPYSDFLFRPGAPLRIIGRRFEESREIAIVRDILTRRKNQRGMRPNSRKPDSDAG